MNYIRGITTGVMLLANITFWGAWVAVFSVARLIPMSRVIVIQLLEKVVEKWAAGNERIIELMHPDLEWRISVADELHLDRSYLVIANHISWVDIPVVQKVLIDRIPFMRFFLKDELRWAPIVGLTAWALEMPFMKRYSAEYLEKHPEKRGKDFETTQHATRRFGQRPGSIISYIEGTRFTTAKHEAQESRWDLLLSPKLGGIAYVIGAVGDRLHGLVDVTISYPARRHILWKLLSAQLPWIAVDVRHIPIPDHLKAEQILSDETLRGEFRQFIHEIWDEKNTTIEARRRGE